MKTRKLKRLGITAVLAVLMMSFAITAMAATQHYEYPVNTTAVNRARSYSNVIAGTVDGFAKVKIVNSGVPTEYYTAKFGTASTGRVEADNISHKFKTGLSIKGGTLTGGIYRFADTGTTMYGYMELDVRG